MKKLIYLFLVLVIVAGCKKNDPDPTYDEATFKVELTQSGKYDAYQRLVKLSAGMVYEGTNESAIIVTDDELENSTYTFVTTSKLSIFEPSVLVGWYGEDAEEGYLELKIYRNDQLIDTKNITLKPVQEGETISYSWTYQAK